MADFLNSAFATSLSISLIIAVLWVLRPFSSKHYHAKWHYWIWLCLALRLALPFNLPTAPIVLKASDKLVYVQNTAAKLPNGAQMPLPATSGKADIFARETADAAKAGEDIKASPNITGEVSASDAHTGAPTSTNIMLSDILLLLWLAGAALFILVKSIGYMLARHSIMRRAKQVFPPELAQILYELDISSNIDVWQSRTVTSPMLIGVLVPCIVLPDIAYSTSHMQMILRHELVHYKRHDILYKCFMGFVCCFYWFNPLVWRMANMAYEDIEISCDEAVVNGHEADFRFEYAESIVNTIEKSYARRILLSTSFSCSKQTVKQRLKSVLSSDSKKRGAIALTAVVVVSLVLSAFVACGTSPVDNDAPVQIEASSAQPIQAPAPTEDMLALINAYEKYKYGCSFNSEIVCPQGNFSDLIYGYLLENGYEKSANCPFIDIESGEPCVRLNSNAFINEIDIKALSAFFTAIDASKFTWYDIRGIALTSIPIMPQLVLKTGAVLPNGDLQYTFNRIYQGVSLKDAVYTMREGKAEEIPTVFADKYIAGDTIYRLVSVSNIDIADSFPEKYIKISTAQQLVDFAQEYNAGEYQCTNCKVVLTNDIDLADIHWTPIGLNRPLLSDNTSLIQERDSTLPGFNGSFDGLGHTIYNLFCQYNAALPENERWCCGLFSKIGTNGNVRNLNFENAIIDGMADNMYTGVASGILSGILYGNIENCNVQGKVESVSATGGLVGCTYENASILGCTADVAVRGSVYAGAFVGSATNATITGCSATGSLTAFDSFDKGFSFGTPAGIGGFIGESFGSIISDCNVDVRLIIEDDGYGIGSFIGVARSFGKVKNSTYTKKSTGAWRPIGLIEDKKPTENPDYQLNGI